MKIKGQLRYECANFASVTQKRSISDSTDILPMWEEKLEETRAKKLFKLIDLCAVLNALIACQSQSFNIGSSYI